MVMFTFIHFPTPKNDPFILYRRTHCHRYHGNSSWCRTDTKFEDGHAHWQTIHCLVSVHSYIIFMEWGSRAARVMRRCESWSNYESATLQWVVKCLWDSLHPQLCALTHWGRDKMAAISQTTLSSAFLWKEMSECRLKFHWSLFIRVQLTIFQHWFR